MKKFILNILFVLAIVPQVFSQEKLIYHNIVTDKNGIIIPWYDKDPGKSFDHVIKLVWNFWDTMRVDMNGLPYYMNHQVWEKDYNDRRGIGGDQLQMALSSWRLLYAYTGNERVKANMRFMADYYLSHSLSPENASWPNIPYPYNTLIYSGSYDGDMVIGKGYTQPDKAGSFGIELVNLYKQTGLTIYLDAAVAIANTLADHTETGDNDHSPMPFKVNAITGEVGKLTKQINDITSVGKSSYTTNWAPALELFIQLQKLGVGKGENYKQAFNKILNWMKDYPLKTNKWGPFFEDVAGWSDTQINAMTFVRFMMQHRKLFPDWQKQVKSVINWVFTELGNKNWEKYGVDVINEQTWYRVPANSHTARQAADELLYIHLTGDSTRYKNAVRQLIWATYMVDVDGKNRFPYDDIWLTDGYGDYVRHFIRAMAAEPQLAPSDKNHILFSSSVVQQADYHGRENKYLWNEEDKHAVKTCLRYWTYDTNGYEIISMVAKPSQVRLNDRILTENDTEGFIWKAKQKGGVLYVYRKNGNHVEIME